MKRTLITLGLTTGLVLGLATTAAGATVSRLQMLNETLYPDTAPAAAVVLGANSDQHLRFIDDVLYPQQQTFADYLCDGYGPCVQLPGAQIPALGGETIHDWQWCPEGLCDF